MEDILHQFVPEITADQEIREQIRINVRDLEQKSRDLMMCFQKIHKADGIKNSNEICKAAREQFKTIEGLYQTLASLIPKGEFYKYHDNYRFTIQRHVSLTALLNYLENDKLIARNESAALLGISVSLDNSTFYLDLEDYLIGVLMMIEELSRFAVNCVTNNEYDKPIKIAQFISEVDTGYRMLNLKNDLLRKKVDSLKYQVKKVEEVVYDLHIRGLKSSGDV